MFRPKRAAEFLAALILLLLLPAVLHPQVFVRVPSGTANHLRAIDFIDDSLGLIAGDFGTILRTTDGGLSWDAPPSGTTLHLLSVCWFSATTAIATGYSGLILRTVDAGSTWSPVSSGIGLPIAGSASFDSTNAIAVGYNGIIRRTTDGGASWTTVFQQTGFNNLGVAYADSLTIVVSGSFGRILRSTDGGTSWIVQSIGAFTFHDVDFTDPLHGIAIRIGSNDFYRTSDGGTNWAFGSLTGTFEDLDHGPDGRWIAAGIGIASSVNGGSTWSTRELSPRMRAVTAFDSGRYVVAGDNGMILRTAVGPIAPPAPELDYPAAGETGAPLSAGWQKEFSLRFAWRQYDAYYPDSVRFQIGLGPGFLSPHFLDSTFRIPSPSDTARFVPRLFPGRKYYWRVRMSFDGVMSPWSAIRDFTGSIENSLLTVRDLQAMPMDSLLLADSLTAIKRDRWSLQASPWFDSTGFLVLRCATDPADLFDPFHFQQGASEGIFFYGVDTGEVGPAWRGIKIMPELYMGPPELFQAFTRLRPGDLIVCTGRVSEDPWTVMDSETSFNVSWFFILDSSGAVPGPSAATVEEFYHRRGPNLLPKYSTGEPLEGGYVELTDLTVHSAGTGPDGTFDVTTRDGLTIGTADYSRWHTLRSHRDETSTYQAPFVGRHIDTLRGFISTTSGDGTSWASPGYRIVPVSPGDIVYGPPTRNIIKGIVYYDSIRDGVRGEEEVELKGWKLYLGGLVSTTLTTLGDGSFAAGGIDSGSYTLTLDLPEGWFLSTPGPASIDFTLGEADTLEPGPFGIYFGWERISGRVFEDVDEDGLWDPGEPGLPGLKVDLSGAGTDSFVTGTDGSYLFDYLEKGMYTVSIGIPSFWEQIVPTGSAGYEVDFRDYDQHVTGRDFSLRPAPFRTKLAITVRDSGDEATRDILFGTRPGASYGVWGADSGATSIDFSEGEFEIPPQIFGLFDARFVDPRGGLESFGEGTWTDIREYHTPHQVDSFRIDFQPGLLLGGSYPMRFFWSRAAAESAYAGTVTIGDAEWNPILDMKAADSLIITDQNVGLLTIVAERPVLRITDVPLAPAAPIPSEFALRQNYPNPFNPETWVPYDVPVTGRVTLRIYDLLGREVAELVDGVKPPGRYAQRWSSAGVRSGIYFARMTAGEYRAVRKMLLVR